MELQEVKKQLPHGAIREIARRSKVSPTTVCQYFQGKIRATTSPAILKAAAEYLTEYKTKEQAAAAELEKALQL